ncbi:SMP-30/gluconolactonase/LRE family protein [Pontiellaceae bacterium B1224]|nr:SMP-30/gluconolactonase/LRE family protein [Pontiellaceae bacterium B1224]
MQTISCLACSMALLFVASICHASEEHLMTDRTGESVIHYAETSPPSSVLATNLPNPWSVEWDADAQAVYWTELGSGSIFRKFIESGTIEQIYSSSNSVLRGLVLDNATDTLYFIDSETAWLNALDLNTAELTQLAAGWLRPNDMVLDRANNALFITDSGWDIVVRYDLNFHNWTYIFPPASELDGVWGIDVVPETGHIYMSDHQTNAIMRADLNGSNLVILVENQETPRGLCVDRHHGRLYWLEAESGELRSSTLEGFDVQTVLTNAAASPRDLASYEFLDQDGDFMNDSRERVLFGNLLEDAYGDADGDGLDNFTEIAFGSSPADPGDSMPGTQLTFTNGIGPSLVYYMRTDAWMQYNLLHSADLQLWDPVSFVDELEFISDGAGGATRTISMDEVANLFGEKRFFKVEVRR